MVGVVDYSTRPASFRPERVRAEMQALRDAGIRWMFSSGVNLLEPLSHPAEEIARGVRGWMDELGIGMSSHHVAAPGYARLDLPQRPIVDNLLRVVEVSAPWRPKSLVLHAGWMSVEQSDIDRMPDSMFTLHHPYWGRIVKMHQEECERHGEDAVIGMAARNYKAMAQAAAKHGMSLAFENMGEFSPLGDMTTMEKLLAAIDEPNVGYCLDSGHAWLHGLAPQDMARRMGDRLLETHFHDNRGRQSPGAIDPRWDEHLPVGFGTTDWRAVVAALDEIGFAGPVTFECGPWPMGNPVAGYLQSVEYWRVCEQLALRR